MKRLTVENVCSRLSPWYISNPSVFVRSAQHEKKLTQKEHLCGNARVSDDLIATRSDTIANLLLRKRAVGQIAGWTSVGGCQEWKKREENGRVHGCAMVQRTKGIERRGIEVRKIRFLSLSWFLLSEWLLAVVRRGAKWLKERYSGRVLKGVYVYDVDRTSLIRSLKQRLCILSAMWSESKNRMFEINSNIQTTGCLGQENRHARTRLIQLAPIFTGLPSCIRDHAAWSGCPLIFHRVVSPTQPMHNQAANP